MATLDRFPYSSAPVKRVKAIQFGILDPDFVEQHWPSPLFFHAAVPCLAPPLWWRFASTVPSRWCSLLAIDELLDARRESPVLSSTRGLTSAFIW